MPARDSHIGRGTRVQHRWPVPPEQAGHARFADADWSAAIGGPYAVENQP